MTTIGDVLQQQARIRPDAVALAAPGRQPLSYAELAHEAQALLEMLAAHGLGRGARIALALPDGPELALTFLATAAGMASAPLNPRYRREEFDFYLSDLGASALVTGLGVGTAAAEAAAALDMPVIEIAADEARGAGCWRLAGDGSRPEPRSSNLNQAQPEDTALLLHTSGTTSRPKLVPLSHSNLLASMTRKARVLELTSADRSLGVMPLFHIHGLVGTLLAPLLVGGSVACPPGFIAPSFFDWVVELRPTWYSAVPTIHQAILARAPRHTEVVATRPFRVIRSSAAALPPTVMTELEQTFECPVLEGYGMTETGLVLTCNPAPPGVRKLGSVGLPLDCEMGIMDADGRLLGDGDIGEVVARSATVTAGYDHNPEATESAFRDGWLRTGDQGYRDADGYYFLTGRLKELINRGGEKISPREIDEVLLAHPGVAQAVTFAIPDAALGEEIGAAVVLRPGADLSELSLRTAVAGQLADFKVPRRILFMDELPRGATGKLQRIGLAEKLGLTSVVPASAESAAHVAPRNETERLLAGIWAEVLGLEQVGVHDDFLGLGGDSILAGMVLARVRATFGLDVPLIEFLDQPTIAEQVELVEMAAFESPASHLP